MLCTCIEILVTECHRDRIKCLCFHMYSFKLTRSAFCCIENLRRLMQLKYSENKLYRFVKWRIKLFQEVKWLKFSFVDWNNLLNSHYHWLIGKKKMTKELGYSIIFFDIDRLDQYIVKKIIFWFVSTFTEVKVGWKRALPKLSVSRFHLWIKHSKTKLGT